MDLSAIFFLILLCTGASFVQRVCGFGFGVFIMTMLPYLCPSYGEATTLSGLLSALQSLYVLFWLYKLVSWRRIVVILLSFTAFSYFAIQFVASATDSYLKMLLGVVRLFLVCESAHQSAPYAYFASVDGCVERCDGRPFRDARTAGRHLFSRFGTGRQESLYGHLPGVFSADEHYHDFLSRTE